MAKIGRKCSFYTLYTQYNKLVVFWLPIGTVSWKIYTEAPTELTAQRCVCESYTLHVVTYHTVAFLTRGSWALFRPAIETLQEDSRAVLYCPEDGRLTFEGWVVVVTKSDSPRPSPNTNGFNNHCEVQWSNPVVETSAGEQLISMWPFAEGWLVSKESHPSVSLQA